jgi:outer membrane receptor for Fe3+-dicitrate
MRLNAGELLRVEGPYVEGSLTWLPVARSRVSATPGSARRRRCGQGLRGAERCVHAQQVSVTGNRLPYASEATYTVAVGFHRPNGLDVRIERYAVGEQFATRRTHRVTVADGQQGTLPAYAIWNLSASQRLSLTGTRLFLSVRNATDELYIADRTRGLLPGSPRSVHIGLKQEF